MMGGFLGNPPWLREEYFPKSRAIDRQGHLQAVGREERGADPQHTGHSHTHNSKKNRWRRSSKQSDPHGFHWFLAKIPWSRKHEEQPWVVPFLAQQGHLLEICPTIHHGKSVEDMICWKCFLGSANLRVFWYIPMTILSNHCDCWPYLHIPHIPPLY